ncbi:phosphonatase-like hydrolase [Embleya sp. NBC_00888]|uniref:phosphonatase-like hydrolase n=1 Tax=Embleya sp. NBC_00888 TaxID=2975960 RepID=UPI00386B3B1B|nr:phosphonatase-like hydrolase [Embleya sp. NBC_00888]
MTHYQLAVLDMAGTTVADDGLVVEAFTRAIGAAGVEVGSADFEHKLGYVHATMGESKITVFRALLDGDEERAQAANLAFEAAYADLVAAGRCAPIEGAEAAVRALRADGVKVALTTGFGRPTQDAILASLGWTDLADLTLCPADAGRGRPYPDLVLTAVLRLGVEDLRAVAVVGDTAFDVLTGLRSGASIAAGVLTGAHDRAALEAAGATHVLGSIRDLPALLQG